MPQLYDYSYQLYKEGDDRIEIESHYIRGKVDINDATSVRFQWLNDAISGASPTGALPTGPQNPSQPYYAEIEDVRTGILAALSRQFGDHRVELEVSRSSEDDYYSKGIALSDAWELNQKNTTLSYGFNYLDDSVQDGSAHRSKHSYDLYSGISQIIDKDTVVSAKLTLGYNEGYLNDPYKIVQRNEVQSIPDGLGGTIDVPVVNIYPENRPDTRFRQVLQLEARRYFSQPDGVLNGILRLSHDDFGVISETLQFEWRQNLGEHFQVVPFFRYYHQSAADFFVQTINDTNVSDPVNPDSGGTHYSADYRLSSFDAISGGVRLRYQFNDIFSANFAYERYVMSGSGSASDQSQDQAYISADIWTVGVNAQF